MHTDGHGVTPRHRSRRRLWSAATRRRFSRWVDLSTQQRRAGRRDEPVAPHDTGERSASQIRRRRVACQKR